MRNAANEARGNSERVAVIIHEPAHEVKHKNPKIHKNTTRQQRELEAEFTGYVVLSHFGIQHGYPFSKRIIESIEGILQAR